ncbi:hypothetical protein K9M18_04685, partial [Candidatus Woesearchaeota archaeon]|nr:hypothetical protein [Candidatus Woesearchaeota archaeon]
MRGTDISDFKRSYRTRNEGEFPQSMVIHLIKSSDKKYGENPNQHAATYKINDMNEVATFRINVDINSVRNDDKGKGGLSLTNELDITRAMDNLKFFEKETAVIMKHNIVSGFATQANKESLDELFRKARDSDLRSNFGGTFVTNKPLNKETAEAMYEKKGQSPFFVDVVAAPSFEEGVIGYLQEQSKNIRIAEFSGLENLPKFKRDD